MLLKAKLAAPRPDFPAFRLPVTQRLFERPATLLMAPEGYFLTDTLAAVIRERHAPTCWLRLGIEDCDPATLLLSLVSGVQQSQPDFGAATFNRMRRQPGPIFGWEMHFRQLAIDLGEVLPKETVLVFEEIDSLIYAPATLNCLGVHFLAHLREDIHCIIISRERLPRGSLPAHTQLIEISDLRLDEQNGLKMADQSGSGLSANCVTRAIGLAGGRVTALANLACASRLLGPALVDQEVKRAASLDDLLLKIARHSLDGSDSTTIEKLSLSMRLEYGFPFEVNTAPTPDWPWLQPLANGWEHLRGLWARPLRKALKTHANPNPAGMQLAADYLALQNATIQAVNLNFELRNTPQAAHMIAQTADYMVDLGQWATLNAWLRRLPAKDLHEWPWLVYIDGKIGAAQGQTEAARKTFAVSTQLFTRKQDFQGAALSLLAESALAGDRGERVLAKERALSAHVLAQRARLNWGECWAAWQLGCLAAAAGEAEEALAWFGPAALLADRAGLSGVGEMLHLAERLIARQVELQKQQAYHQQALLEAERAELEIAERMQHLLEAPPDNLASILEIHGWMHIPLMTGISARVPGMPAENELGLPHLMTLLLQAFKTIPPAEQASHLAAAAASSMPTPPKEMPPSPINSALSSPARTLEGGSREIQPPTAPDTANSEARAETTSPLNLAGPLAPVEISSPIDPTDAPDPSEPAATGSAAPGQDPPVKGILPKKTRPAQLSLIPMLSVGLLGDFSVQLNQHLLTDWPNNRGCAIFKYLVLHRGQPTPREVLMDTFWPNAGPESARNNLNVAMHSLRVTLHTAGSHPLVRFHNGAYQLDPELNIWVDVSEFETHIQAGRQKEEAAQPEEALREYEAAIALYKGDLLATDFYEEWPVLVRERLRVTYLETLDRMSQIYFHRGEFNACITLCQFILGVDACREDAHCRLMSCYSRLGQDHLALRQYQVCVDALRAELDVNPAPATTHLYEKIRQHTAV